MEAKINVAEILKDKPENTKLYSPLFGDVYFSYIENSIIKVKHHGGITKFFDNSRYYNYPESEPLLFPSKEMRDWSKFAWKRGDVLVSDDGCIEVIFDKWYDDTYTSFYGKHYLDSENENDIVYIEAFICTTERFSLEDKESFLCYINTIEERLGGKLNRETLEIEKTQPEFKDGDIIVMKAEFHGEYTLITKGWKAQPWRCYCFCNNSDWVNTVESDLPFIASNIQYRKPQKEEKEHLLNNLHKKGKRWNAETKTIEDIKPKCKFKPLDYVLSNDNEDNEWTLCQFSHFDKKGNAVFVGGSYADKGKVILSYKDNEHLLGTTKDVEE